MSPATIFTIGHSTHQLPHLVDLLSSHGVTAVADVRSTPASRFTPQFNQGSIKKGLQEAGIKYVFLGKELGARAEDPACYVEGKVQYDRLAKTPRFLDGIERLIRGAHTERISVMCTEGDPLDCHRTILIAQEISKKSVLVDHIHNDGQVESHSSAMERL